MRQHLITYVAVIGVLMMLDALWLGVIANSLYQTKVGHFMADIPNFYAAIGFYRHAQFNFYLLCALPNRS